MMLDARVGGALPGDVKAADIRNLFTYSALCGLVTPAMPHGQWRLVDGLRSIGRRPDTFARVLIFDQFEELFTQHRERFEHREGFFEDLVDALHDDPGLRVVLAMRQEYLADIDPLAELLPAELTMQRMVLKRLGSEAALEAIMRPAARYAVFAPGVAEAIVWQLNTIRVPGFDRVLVEKRGEFIEMVHLQIVCDHLWSHLPAGITRIEMDHVDGAAGEGQTFNEFVVNALNQFYDSTITKVSESAATRQRGGYSKDLIRLGMMKFVTPASTRTMVPQAHGRVGRLPDWIIEQLENEHLIRFEQRGGQRWYELSHDRLAGPVGRQMDRQVSALLFAADLLAKVHENVMLERPGGLSGYFGEHRDVLAECRPFEDQVGLFDDEAEFVFRASICSGQDMRAWSRRIAQDFPQVRVAVLKDALLAGTATVRCNALELLGVEPADELSGLLVDAALRDSDDTVSRAASLSLAQLDRADLFESLVQALDGPARAGAMSALIHIRAAADGPVHAPTFEMCYARLRAPTRRRIRRQSWARRLRENAAVLAFVFVPAATFAAVTAATFKLLPAAANWSVTQGRPSFVIGIFQGGVAGVIWAGLITVGITMYHTVFGNDHRPRSVVRPIGAIVAAAVSGFVGSGILVFVVIGVFQPQALVEMGWLSSATLGRFSPPFLADVFVRTRFGWVDFITGAGLGVGTALVTNRLRASAAWAELLRRERRMTGVDDAIAVARELTRMSLPSAWLLPAAVAVSAVLAFTVPELRPDHPKANAIALSQGLIGDCATQIIGAFWGIVGMNLGLVVMRSGFRIEPKNTQT